MSRYKWRLRPVSAFVALLVLAGCGASATDHHRARADTSARHVTPARPDTREAAEHALQLWSRLPVTSPPPVLLINGSVLAPAGGLGTGDAKVAFLQGRFTLHAQLPQSPSRFRGWPVIDARRALAVWKSQSSTGPGPIKARLAITGGRLETASFSTEHGPRILPAWAFSVRGLENPVEVLALPDTRVFVAPTAWDGKNATVSGDGRTIRVGFTGGHAGDKPCDDSYTGNDIADNHAVAVWIVDHPVKGSAICDALGYPRTVVIRLNRPLGSRALVDSSGAPVPMCPTNRRASALTFGMC